MNLAEKLLKTANEVNKEKEIKENKKKEEERNTLQSNAKYYWEKYFIPELEEAANKGITTFIFRFAKKGLFGSQLLYPILTDNNTYHRNTIEAYYTGEYNKNTHSFYSYTNYGKYPIDVKTIYNLAKENGFYCNLQELQMADSKTGKYFRSAGSSYDLTLSLIKLKPVIIDYPIIESRKIPVGLRYDILRRDNFKCQICGRSQADGIKLHVDHIIPFSKGGKTEPNNLRTLCQDCNLGKSNKIE